MERGENRSSDKDCGGFSERTCGNVLTKKDILYALRAILVMNQKWKMLYCLSIFRFLHPLYAQILSYRSEDSVSSIKE